MKKILLINHAKAYLPEIRAYQMFFNNKSGFYFYDSSELRDYTLKDFDAVWHFMGIDSDQTDIVKIHEYGSLSTGRFPKVKNFIKKKSSVQPDLRIFLNTCVKNEMNFNDNIPYCLRDMGIDNSFFNRNDNKNHDFVYSGTIDKSRNIDRLLYKFQHDLADYSLLIIGYVPPAIYQRFKNVKNITFSGRVPYQDVPALASQAIYGINLVPDKYPFNLQTSTKLLEYCALNLKIITTSYLWLHNFEKEYNGVFYKVDDKFESIDTEEIKKLPFYTPNVEHLTWEHVIKKAGLEEKLQTVFTRKN